MASPNNDIDPSKVPDEIWNLARERERVIRKIVAAPQCSGSRSETVTAAAAELRITRAYCYRLIKAYRSDPRLRSLLPGAPGPKAGTHRRLKADVEMIIGEELQKFYLTTLKPTKTAVVKAIQARCVESMLPKPARVTILRRIAAIGEFEKTRRRLGSKVARGKLGPAVGSLTADRPLQIVQIDHTPMDVMAVEQEGLEVIGRPFITLAIDVCTRMYCGFHITFDPPSAASVAACLSHAVSEKDSWLQSRGLPSAWPVSGLPECIHVDNGKEFHSRAFTRACEDYGIEVRYRPPGAPHMGGHVERRLGHLAQELHLLHGTTFSNVREKGSYDSEGKACLTIAEIEWLVATIVLEHHATFHSGVGTSPLAKWETATADVKPRLPADQRSFYRDFLPFEERRIQRDGLHLFGIRYWHDALVPYLRDKMPVVVHYDPSDLSKVFIRGPSGEYLDVPYRNLSRPPVSKWELKAITRALRRKGRSGIDESMIFDMVLKRRTVLESARSRSRQARLQHARSASRQNRTALHALPSPAQRDTPVSTHDLDTPIELPYYDTEEWD